MILILDFQKNNQKMSFPSKKSKKKSKNTQNPAKIIKQKHSYKLTNLRIDKKSPQKFDKSNIFLYNRTVIKK